MGNTLGFSHRSHGTSVDRARLDNAYISFRTDYAKGLELAKPLYPSLATVVNDPAERVEYKWLGSWPMARKWLGDRIVKKLSAHTYGITVEDWEASIEVPYNDIQRDRLGVWSMPFQELGRVGEDEYDELIFQLLINGTGATYGLSFDGQYFFDTDHQVGSEAAWSNTGTLALDETNLNARYEAMCSRLSDVDRPLGIRPTKLVVGPWNRTAAAKLLKDKNDAGADNVNKNLVELVEWPRLVGAYKKFWFLIDDSRGIKPTILQRSKGWQFTESDEHLWSKKVMEYGIDGEHNAGYGLPHLIDGQFPT